MSSVSLCMSRKAVACERGGAPYKVHPRNSAVTSRQSTILTAMQKTGMDVQGSGPAVVAELPIRPD